MQTQILFILCFNLLLFSCYDTDSRTEKKEKQLSFNENVHEQLLSPQIYKKMNGSLSRFLLRDSMVYFSNYHNTNFVMNVVNLFEDTSTIHHTIPFGTGPEELTYVSDLSLHSDTIVQILDRNINRLFQYSISDLRQEEKPTPLSAIFIKDFFPKEPIQVNDNQWFTNLFMTGAFTTQFIQFDREQNIRATNIAYPKIDRHFQHFFMPEVFNCSICYNDVDRIMAVAYYHMELIEFFSTKDSLTSLLRLIGDEKIQPNFEPVKTDDGALILDWTDEVYEVFFSIQCNDELLFVAYKNPGRSGINESWHDTILVLDWDGKIIARLKLETPITGSFSVDFDNNQLLGVSEVEDRGFVVYEYEEF